MRVKLLPRALAIPTLLALLTTVLPVQNIAIAHTKAKVLKAKEVCHKPVGMSEYRYYPGNATEPKGWFGAKGARIHNREAVFNFCNSQDQHIGHFRFKQSGRSVVGNWNLPNDLGYTAYIYYEKGKPILTQRISGKNNFDFMLRKGGYEVDGPALFKLMY